MGYKTELQSNNTDLQSILDSVNNLPEAGSEGSGSGGVETCTVELDIYEDNGSDTAMFTYFDTNGARQTIDIPAYNSFTGSITMRKGFLVIYGTFSAPAARYTTVEGDITTLVCVAGVSAYSIFEVTGDGSIIVVDY